MKRGCCLRIWDDDKVREAMQEAVGEVCRALFNEADKHNEKPHYDTIRIQCFRDFDRQMIRVEGTLESSPRPIEYKDALRMYLDELVAQQKDGDGE